MVSHVLKAMGCTSPSNVSVLQLFSGRLDLVSDIVQSNFLKCFYFQNEIPQSIETEM